jgi:hypothetical protein
VVEDGDGEEHQKVVDSAKASDEGAARRDVDRGQDKEVGGQRDVREEDVPAFGIADDQDKLDGGIEEVEGAEEEGAQRRAEERGKEKEGRQRLGGRRKNSKSFQPKKR